MRGKWDIFGGIMGVSARTVLACYLVAEGTPPREAIAAVRKARPGSIETFDQERTVETYLPPPGD